MYVNGSPVCARPPSKIGEYAELGAVTRDSVKKSEVEFLEACKQRCRDYTQTVTQNIPLKTKGSSLCFVLVSCLNVIVTTEAFLCSAFAAHSTPDC